MTNDVRSPSEAGARLNFLVELLHDLASSCTAQLDIESIQYKPVGKALAEVTYMDTCIHTMIYTYM